jgi:hypothetical protein
MQRYALEIPVNLKQLRQHLSEMTDEELRRFGRAALIMCGSGATFGASPLKSLVVQVEEFRPSVAGGLRRQCGESCVLGRVQIVLLSNK